MRLRRTPRSKISTLAIGLLALISVILLNLNSDTSRSLKASTSTISNADIALTDAEINGKTEISRRAQAQSPVIVVLIHDRTNITDLCMSIKTLANVQGGPSKAPIISFHLEDYPTHNEESYLRSCTDRSIYFAVVDLDEYPPGFTPNPNIDYTDAQVNRFWTTGIWEHNIIQPYDIIMKIDQDSCFSLPNPTLPDFAKKFQNFHSQYFPGAVEFNTARLSGMYRLAQTHMLENNMIPRHSFLWQRVTNTMAALDTLPSFQDSFEVVRRDFMLRPEVRAWHHKLTDEEPWGYFTKGWNVDGERFLTMAMFGTPSSIDTTPVPGFVYKDLMRDVRHHKICTYPFEQSLE